MAIEVGVFALSGALKEYNTVNHEITKTIFAKKPEFNLTLAENLYTKTEIFPEAQYYTAGTVEQRVAGLKALDPDVYYALKGGYGVQHCVDEIDKLDLGNKVFFGYSDLTALFIRLYKKYQDKVSVFYSPMFNELAEISEAESKAFFYFLENHNKANYKEDLLELTVGLKDLLDIHDSVFLKEECFVWGGNLSLLVAENYIPKIGKKNILFVEDCYEEAYKIERLFFCLKNQGFLENIDELWLGEEQETRYNLELVESFAKDYGFKLIYGLPFGHKTRFTLPLYRDY